MIRSEEGPLSAEVQNSDPAYARQGALGVALETFENYVVHVDPLEGHEDDPAAQRASKLTNEWLAAAFEVLDSSEVNAKRRAQGKLPGNFVLTRDGGDHWTPIFDRQLSLGIGEPGAIAIDPTDTSIIYVGTSSRVTPQAQAGLFRSTDGGASCIRVGSGFPADNVGNASQF